MSSTEEQLISFFAYSMFIYPVTAWLVSPRRSYGRWKGAIYAMLFLAAIFFVQLVRRISFPYRGISHPALTAL